MSRRAPPFVARCVAGLLGLLGVQAFPELAAAAESPLAPALERHRAGDLEGAMAAYRELIATSDSLPSELLGEAHNNACAALNDLGRYGEAIAHCRTAAQLRRAGVGTLLADTLVNLALALEATGDPEGADAAYQEAGASYRAAGSAADEALVLSNRASLAVGRGDFGAALERTAEAEALARAAGDDSWATEELRVVHLNRAVILERLGAYREALAELQAARAAGGRDPAHAALERLNVAVLYRNLGDPWRALAELDGAAADSARLGATFAATLSLNRGLVHLINLEDPAAALPEFETALAAAEAAGDVPRQAWVRVARGEAGLALGRLAEAEADFRAALDLARSADAAESRWQGLAGLGRAAARRGDPAAALEHLAAAIDEIDRVAAGSGAARWREGLVADQRSVFAAAVDLLARRALAGDLPAAAEALAVGERARARELLVHLAGAGSAPLDAAAIRAGAGRDGPVVVFFAGAERLWRFLLADGEVAVADVGATAARLAEALAVHASLARGEVPDPALLELLGEALLGGLPTFDELTLVPDRTLFYLPFDLLPIPDAPGVRLLDRTALATAPSLSVRARLLARPAARAPRWNLLALADPELPARPATASATALIASRFDLPALPAARLEASRAAARLGGETVVEVGRAASEARLAERAREGARVLLIAAHTLIDERLERGVAIFLAPSPAGSDTAGDGALEPPELAALPLAVDLAVLSGCRTALSGHGDGRSLASLSGGLLAGGARGVVATLWEVGDQPAAALMDLFFWELGRGTPPRRALQRAKRRLAGDERWAGRLDWSAFVLIGEPPAVAPRRPIVPALAVAALLVAAVLLVRLGGRRAAARERPVSR